MKKQEPEVNTIEDAINEIDRQIVVEEDKEKETKVLTIEQAIEGIGQ